jgi:hypothetical protein
MRRRFRYDPDLDAVVEIGSNYFEERPEGPSVIRDDLGAGVNGLRYPPSGKQMDSKSAFRRENRARGLEEVGSETNFASKSRPREDYGQMVKDAHDQIQGNWNGTADWLRHKERG